MASVFQDYQKIADPGGAYLSGLFVPPRPNYVQADPTAVPVGANSNRGVTALAGDSNISPPSKGFNWADPGFLNLLAGIGAGLDKEGVGGAIGNATIAYNKSKISEKALTDKQVEHKKWLDGVQNKLGPMGSESQSGPREVKVNKDGSVTYTIDPPSHLKTQPPTSTGQVGSGQTSQPTSSVQTPFLQALG